MEEYSPLYKSGKNWYVSPELFGTAGPYEKPIMLYPPEGRKVEAVVCTADDGRLLGFRDRNGKGLSGIYSLDEMDCVIKLKNGLPVTGKFTVSTNGMTYTFNPDPETGITWMTE